MAEFEDLHERVYPLLSSEVPVTTTANGLLGRSDRCAAWVDAVYLHSSIVVVRTCLILRPDLFVGDKPGVVSLVDGGMDVDGPPEVETTLGIDDAQPLSAVDGTLYFGDAQSSTLRSQAEWWLPGIPADRLQVGMRWARGGLDGFVTFDATGWRATANTVLGL